MNNELKFFVNNIGRKHIKAFLVIPGNGNSLVAIRCNTNDFFKFATNFSIKNNIYVRKEKTKINGKTIFVYTFDKANYIISSFSKDLNITDDRIKKGKLNKKVIRGLIIGMIGMVGVNTINNFTSSKDNIKSRKTVHELDSNNEFNNSFIAGIGNLLKNVDFNEISVDSYISNNHDINNEMDLMQADNQFSYNFEDRSKSAYVDNAKQYYNLFECYGNIYGIDPNMLMAIMCQESNGIHQNYSENGHAMGAMQIEDVWDQQRLSAYNFETKTNEVINVDWNMLSDIEYNIKVSAMILQTNLRSFNYDAPKALQAYNMGISRIKSMGDDWNIERKQCEAGDSDYLEHVFSYLPSGICLNFKNENESIINIQINNLNSFNNSVMK